MLGLVNLICGQLHPFSLFSITLSQQLLQKKMNHAVKPVYLRQRWRWQIQYFTAHMIIFIRGWLSVINTYVTFITPMTFGSRETRGWQMFCVCGEHVLSQWTRHRSALDSQLSHCSCNIHLNDSGARGTLWRSPFSLQFEYHFDFLKRWRYCMVW